MKFLVYFVFLTYQSLALSKSSRIFSCPVPNCTNCALEINLNTKKAEFMNNGSTYILKMESVSDKTRVFILQADAKVPTPVYKLNFNRVRKTASLYKTMTNQSEEEVFKNANCRLSTKAHNPTF